MGRPKTIDDAQLLAIARQVFADLGHAATTRDVAQAAGISQAVLFHRFRSKDDLFFAAMMPAPPDVAALLGPEPVEPAAVPAHLTEVAIRILGYLGVVIPAVIRLVTYPAAGTTALARAHEGPMATQLAGALAERLATLQRRGWLEAPEPAAAAEAMLAAVHSVAMGHALAGSTIGPEDEDRLAKVIQVLWRGLRPSGA